MHIPSIAPRRAGRLGAALIVLIMLAALLPVAASAATAPSITSAATTTFTVGVAGTFTVTTAGVPTPAVARTGAVLPSGVTFADNGNGTGTLAGTPAAATNGSYALTFTASNGNLPNAVQDFTLVVSPGTAPTISSATSTTFTVGVAGTFTVTTTGVPTPAIVRTGAALPSGVTFADNHDGTGTLSGTPAAGTNGSYAITFTASNGNLPNAVRSFTLVVSPGTAPKITSAATTTFTIGVPGTFTVTTTGVPTPAIVRTGAVLPSGVTFTDNGNGTGTLAGTPAAGTNGRYAMTFTASNGRLPNAVQRFSLVVSVGGPTVTINQAAGQADPTSSSPINFTVVFSAAVTGFLTGDVTVGGTAGGTKIGTVTALSTTTYNVAVTGMTTGGTVIATVPAGVALSAASLPNLASTSTDNTVTWAPATASLTLVTSAPIPPGAHNPVITWGQGFVLSVAFAANGASRSVALQGTTDLVIWTTITSLTTDAAGRASYFYTPIKNLWYRVVFAGTTDLAAATSNTVRTVVRQIAILRPTNHGAVRSIGRNASITFSTTVRPARPELARAVVSFWFYRQSGGVWLLVAKRNVTIDGAGLARTTFTFSSSGQWYVRCQANPTPVNANSVMSLTERYSVG